MKRNTRFIIGIVLAVGIGYAGGIFTMQLRDTSSFESRTVPDKVDPRLEVEVAHLAELKTLYTDQNPKVIDQRERIQALREEQKSK